LEGLRQYRPEESPWTCTTGNLASSSGLLVIIMDVFECLPDPKSYAKLWVTQSNKGNNNNNKTKWYNSN
jgi:hypothetical protein